MLIFGTMVRFEDIKFRFVEIITINETQNIPNFTFSHLILKNRGIFLYSALLARYFIFRGSNIHKFVGLLTFPSGEMGETQLLRVKKKKISSLKDEIQFIAYFFNMKTKTRLYLRAKSTVPLALLQVTVCTT